MLTLDDLKQGRFIWDQETDLSYLILEEPQERIYPMEFLLAQSGVRYYLTLFRERDIQNCGFFPQGVREEFQLYLAKNYSAFDTGFFELSFRTGKYQREAVGFLFELDYELYMKEFAEYQREVEIYRNKLKETNED